MLKSFAALLESLPYDAFQTVRRLRLLIVGGGPDEGRLKLLAEDLGISQVTEFRGRVPHASVPDCLRELDIFVALSRNESFGVAILEASACGLPVVVSDADGPKEVTVDGHTGFVVPRDDVEAASQVIKRLILDDDLRCRELKEASLNIMDCLNRQ